MGILSEMRSIAKVCFPRVFGGLEASVYAEARLQGRFADGCWGLKWSSFWGKRG